MEAGLGELKDDGGAAVKALKLFLAILDDGECVDEMEVDAVERSVFLREDLCRRELRNPIF